MMVNRLSSQGCARNERMNIFRLSFLELGHTLTSVRYGLISKQDNSYWKDNNNNNN